MSAVVRLDQDGPLAVLTFDSPPLNLFDDAMFDGLRGAIDQVAADPPRGLLIRAEGKVVSGGVDVGKVFDGMSPERGGALWDELLEVIHIIEELPLPTVFAAHGLCLTAAFEIALGCDILLASEKARFGLVEIVVGLTPSMGGPQRLAERAGPARAKELIYTGELYDAATLERWNVVNRVYAPDAFEASARAFATKIANGPTRAHAATKAIVRAQKEGGARAADAIVGEVSGALFATEDLKNAVRSFLEDGPGRATYEGR
ncbi:MAG TPA: enoyl-CoA hydratase/isomerase family protein [Baekduia sp.]|uniref:enoyl-CoA hydratase/isomerase family protein n=1 Tax=Baekduia sp. TaxID=2600305 RepID=UPI002C85BDC1|nr:enoyl-CoA hydratase/isomerase family protein [Baekduia sp.]HMJ33255.1 enoyl-CoA hydratase/isomerase family protein [Baekduia sp.]